MPRKQHTYHYIYKTTCKISGKYYVGMHSTSNLEDGYIGSGKRLWNSIRKHGRENHSIEILEWFSERSSLKEREKELVNESLLQDPMCMNLKLGGEGGFCNEEHKMKFVQAGIKSMWNSQNFRKRKTEWMNNLNRNGCKDYRKIQEKNSFYGKFHAEDSRKKIGEKSSISQSGEKNSQSGTKWIFNLELKLNKKVKKEDPIPSGWNLGRKKF